MLTRSEIESSIRHALTQAHQDAISAAKRAHDTATSKESVAENKYDTFGLEASYLAHGQSLRVAECQADLIAYEQLFTRLTHRANKPICTASATEPSDQVSVGHVVELVDENENVSLMFVGPRAGGLKVMLGQQRLMLITPQSPLGQQLLTRSVGDEISLTMAGSTQHYEIRAIGL